MSIDELNVWIRAADPRALERLADQDGCGLASDGTSPFDAAIEADNRAVIELLAQRKGTHAHCAPVDPSLLGPIRHTLASAAPIQDVAASEASLRAAFGPHLGFQRTPLLQACRKGHLFAIEQLLAADAKPGGKDLLGLSEPELCLLSGGSELLAALLAACRRHRRKLVLSETLIETLLQRGESPFTVVAGADVSAGGRRLLLALACARLDMQQIERLLAGIGDVNACVSKQTHPVYEACTSRLLWLHAAPDYLEFAGRFARVAGPAGSQSLHASVSANASLQSQLAAARELQRARQAELDAWQPSSDWLAEQTRLRIAIIDRLLRAGLDPLAANKKAPDFWVRDILLLRDAALWQALRERGFDLQPQPYELERIPADLQTMLQQVPSQTGDRPTFLALQKAPAIWQLDGETSLLLRARATGADGGYHLRATVHNSYGPLPDCGLELGLSREPSVDVNWRAFRCLEQLIEIEGDIVPWTPATPQADMETPWSATFDAELQENERGTWVQLRMSSADAPSQTTESVRIDELLND